MGCSSFWMETELAVTNIVLFKFLFVLLEINKCSLYFGVIRVH